MNTAVLVTTPLVWTSSLHCDTWYPHQRQNSNPHKSCLRGKQCDCDKGFIFQCDCQVIRSLRTGSDIHNLLDWWWRWKWIRRWMHVTSQRHFQLASGNVNNSYLHYWPLMSKWTLNYPQGLLNELPAQGNEETKQALACALPSSVQARFRVLLFLLSFHTGYQKYHHTKSFSVVCSWLQTWLLVICNGLDLSVGQRNTHNTVGRSPCKFVRFWRFGVYSVHSSLSNFSGQTPISRRVGSWCWNLPKSCLHHDCLLFPGKANWQMRKPTELCRHDSTKHNLVHASKSCPALGCQKIIRLEQRLAQKCAEPRQRDASRLMGNDKCCSPTEPITT